MLLIYVLICGQSYRPICINMHIWHGVGILVIFATIGEKENPKSPTPCARDAETYKRRTRAGRRASAWASVLVWTKRNLFVHVTVFADKSVSIQCRLIVFDDCLLADCFDIELLNNGMARSCCSH